MKEIKVARKTFYYKTFALSGGRGIIVKDANKKFFIQEYNDCTRMSQKFVKDLIQEKLSAKPKKGKRKYLKPREIMFP